MRLGIPPTDRTIPAMDIFAEFHRRTAAIMAAMAARGALPEALDLGRFTVEPPRDAAHGDLATNAAMVFAKEAKPAFGGPRQLATEIAAALAALDGVDRAEVAGPGFINIRVMPEVLALS